MYKNFIITESEKYQIKKLYGLVSEQSTTSGTQNPEITLDLADTFGSGKYLIPNKVEKLEDIINQIREFKKQNQGSVIEITINSGESQVPNYDREKFPTKGDYRKEAKLPVGDLGKFRSESLKKYLETNAPDLLKDSKIVISEPVIGQTKWNPDGGDKPEDEKFTKEQFVNFTIKAIGKVPGGGSGVDVGCVTGLEFEIYVPGHKCNYSEFFLVLNNTLIKNTNGGMTANLNNWNTSVKVGGVKLPAEVLNPGYGYLGTRQYGTDGNLGGPRIAKFIVDAAQSAKIVKEGNGKINVWWIATTLSAHDDIAMVKITKSGSIEPIFNAKPNVAKGLLLVMDACGNEVITTPSEGEQSNPPNVDSYIDQLVAERNGIVPNIENPIPVTMDSKQKIHEKVAEIREKVIAEYLKFLRPPIPSSAPTSSAATWWNNYRQTDGVRAYLEITNILNSSGLARNADGKYNDTIESNLYKDVKKRLDYFYLLFNLLYYKDSEKRYDAKSKNYRELEANVNRMNQAQLSKAINMSL